MSYRCRWFEYLCYRPLLQQYYDADPKMRHEAAPKPRLTDADYHPDYLSEKIGEAKRLEWAAAKHFVTTEEEPLFESPLFGLENIVVTPHMAGLTESGKVGAAVRAAKNALAVLNGEVPKDSLNPTARREAV